MTSLYCATKGLLSSSMAEKLCPRAVVPANCVKMYSHRVVLSTKLTDCIKSKTLCVRFPSENSRITISGMKLTIVKSSHLMSPPFAIFLNSLFPSETNSEIGRFLESADLTTCECRFQASPLERMTLVFPTNLQSNRASTLI